MTKDEILNMPAGRAMDAVIADCVFDMEIVPPETPTDNEDDIHARPNDSTDKWIYCKPLRYYSTDIAAAWEVVEKMAHPPFAWWIESINTSDGVLWFISYWNDEGVDIEVYDKSAPLAICRAALLSVENL